MDPRNLVAPLRVAQASRARLPDLAEETAKEIQVALRIQENWDAWLAERELLRNETERGKDCLAQARRELEELRWKLEHWPAFERICGQTLSPSIYKPLMQENASKDFSLPGLSAAKTNSRLSLPKWRLAPTRMGWSTFSN